MTATFTDNEQQLMLKIAKDSIAYGLEQDKRKSQQSSHLEFKLNDRWNEWTSRVKGFLSKSL